MNERVKDLWQLAACYVNPLKTGGEWQAEFVEKFAELIAKECIEVVKWTPSQFPNDEYVKNIKEHFGLKEPQGWVCPKCGVDRTKEACPSGHNAALTGQCPMVGVAQ